VPENCAGKFTRGVCQAREEIATASAESSVDMRVAFNPVCHLLAAVFHSAARATASPW